VVGLCNPDSRCRDLPFVVLRCNRRLCLVQRPLESDGLHEVRIDLYLPRRPALRDPLQSFAHDPQSGPSRPKRNGNGIQRTGRSASCHFEHMGVDHGCRHIRMTKQFLHGSDIGARLQQMGGE
jgi:hypothetical protein